MHWDMHVGGVVLLSLRVDPEFFEWLRPRVTDSEIVQFDPYRDSVLDLLAQERWLTALSQACEALRGEARTLTQQTHRLPSDPQARESIVTNLVDRALSQHPWRGLLTELIASLQLSRESHGTIRVLGD